VEISTKKRKKNKTKESSAKKSQSVAKCNAEKEALNSLSIKLKSCTNYEHFRRIFNEFERLEFNRQTAYLWNRICSFVFSKDEKKRMNSYSRLSNDEKSMVWDKVRKISPHNWSQFIAKCQSSKSDLRKLMPTSDTVPTSQYNQKSHNLALLATCIADADQRIYFGDAFDSINDTDTLTNVGGAEHYAAIWNEILTRCNDYAKTLPADNQHSTTYQELKDLQPK
jgi:hypothetical protein